MLKILQAIRKDFPFLQVKRNGFTPIFFDNAATSQKPNQVLTAMQQAYLEAYNNVHRGICYQGEMMTYQYEAAREKVKNFLNADSVNEIIFTKGTTESINLVAHSLGQKFQPGDEIILTYMEHHSNIVPWQALAKLRNLTIKFVELDVHGNLAEISSFLSNKTKIVAFTQCSNVLGTINNVKEIVTSIKKFDPKIAVLVDGAQAVANLEIDVRDFGCDFFVFSGHKMYGPNGIGVLYAKREWHDSMMLYQTGGGMINEVTTDNFSNTIMPWKFEAGTPNIVGAIGLSAAIDYITSITKDYIRYHNKLLLESIYEQLYKNFAPIEILGSNKNKSAIVAFKLVGLNSQDVAFMLSQYNICVRADSLCAQPLLNYLKSEIPIRVSFGIYNTKEEIDFFIQKMIILHRKLTSL